MNRHIATVHENRRNSQCDVCGKNFISNSDLKKHIQEVHMKINRITKKETPNQNSTNAIIEYDENHLDTVLPKLEITESKNYVKCELSEDYFSKDSW